MTAGAVGLVLVAALLHALWNLRLHDSTDRLAVVAVAGLVAGPLLAPFVILDPPVEALGSVAVSTVAQTVYVVALAAAYRRGDLSLTYPVGRGTAPLLATLLAGPVLGQRTGAAVLLGAVCMAVGLTVLGLEAWRARTPGAFELALLVGVAIATYSVSDAVAVAKTGPLGYVALPLFASGVLVAAGLRFDRSRLRSALRPGIWVGVGSVAAYGMVLFAFRIAPVGNVATLRETSVPIALALTAERVSARRWLGAGACVAGAVLVILA